MLFCNYSDFPAGTTLSAWSDTGVLLVDRLELSGRGMVHPGFPKAWRDQTILMHIYGPDGAEISTFTLHAAHRRGQ